ncbi:uroporphyrinogen decarboxylase family protein [Termitidicoccus mucosus]
MKSTRGEDMRAALACKQPPSAVPVWELEFQAWDNVSGRHLVLGREFAALSSAEKEKTMHANAEIIISVCRRLHFAALTMPGCYWETAPGVPAYYWLPDGDREKQIAILKRLCESEGILTVVNRSSLVQMPGSADNYEEFCYMLMDRPEEMDAHAGRLLESAIETAKRLADAGHEAVLTASDIADNRGLFFSPAQMDRWFFPHLEKWASALKKLGLFSILHTDGNISAIVEKLAASPLDAVQALDPVAGMDIAEVKQKTQGRLCLCGNIESGLLMTGVPAAIYEKTRATLAACKAGGGYVLGASNACYPATPPENYAALLAAWQEHGQY